MSFKGLVDIVRNTIEVQDDSDRLHTLDCLYNLDNTYNGDYEYNSY